MSEEGPMIADISRHRDELQALCRRFHVRRLEIFGSAARGDDFDPARSDIDFLVEFAADSADDLARFIDFKAALEALLARRVDLVDRKAIESSRNYIRKRHILAGAEPVYAA
jgi:predicted nucleotidyltransferase